MKKLIIFLLIISFTGNLRAQGIFETTVPDQYAENQTDLNLGLGLINFYSSYASSLPTISFSYERGLSDHISAGGFLAYSSYISQIDYRSRSSHGIFGVRAAYHLPLLRGFDTYGGVAAGLRLQLDSYISPARNPLSPVGGIGAVFVGSRYHFTENLGVYGELSFGISLINLGLTYRIR